MKTARYFLLCLAGLLLTLAGQATDIRRIETEMWLHRNGNAVVTQTWDVNITRGTEWYIPIENLGDRWIRDFHVFENDHEFANEGTSWNSDRTLEQKKNRCGIVKKSNGVELCWGQGEYGDHVYRIIYIIENLVQQMADTVNAGFNWQFINDELAAEPQQVRMTIHNLVDTTTVWQAGDGGNMGIWVFGCEADYGVENGDVVIEATEPLGYYDNLTVLMRFDADQFVLRTRDSRTFEQMRTDAFLDSNYFDGDDYEIDKDAIKIFLKSVLGLLAAIMIIPLLLIFIPVLIVRGFRRGLGIRYKKNIFGKSRITGWSRDVPFEGRLDATYSLLRTGDKLSYMNQQFSQLVGAYFLRWVQRGYVVAEKDPKREGRMNLRFPGTSPEALETNDPMEKELYKAARSAAGTNFILENDEFKTWSEKHYTQVTGWPAFAASSGRQVWQTRSKKELCEAIQFKNFLNHFTLSDERSVPEVTLWEEYLVFAQLFGIAEKVSKSFQKLYPDLYSQYAAKSHMLDAATTYEVLRSVSRSSSSFLSAAQAKRSAASVSSYSSSSSSSSHTRYSGGGGHSSHHGGGGHHGGGHGGGSR